MRDWKAVLQVIPHHALLVTSEAGDVLKARLPLAPRHPRGAGTLLEGLALWGGEALCVAVSVEPSSSDWAGLFGDDLFPARGRSCGSASSTAAAARTASKASVIFGHCGGVGLDHAGPSGGGSEALSRRKVADRDHRRPACTPSHHGPTRAGAGRRHGGRADAETVDRR